MTTLQSTRIGPPIEVDERLLEDIRLLIKEQAQGMLRNLLVDLYPVDVALLLEHLSLEEARSIFRLLPQTFAAEVIAELEGALREHLLEDLSPHAIADLLDELDTDDVADVVAELPEAVQDSVLAELEDAEDVRELLSFGEETAGGIMGTEYIAVPTDATVEEATEEVRRQADVVDPLHVVFVTDAEGRLEGLLPLKALLLHPAHTPVREIMDREVISVTPEMDQEEVARIMEKYDLVVLPVVQEDKRLLGRITVDDVLDVIREEVEEDIYHIGGTGDESWSDSLFKVSRGRLPWLFLGLIGTLFSGFVVSLFQASLQEAVVLATFIPIMTAMAGNAAIQSSAITVQGLVSGRLWSSDLWRRLLREMGVAVVNGLILATLLSFVILISGLAGERTLRLAVTAGISLLMVVLLATTNGAFIPLILHRLGIDPAVSMGPFVTTANDILGLAIYFIVATQIYL